ncbi:MarR family winged helix-turn-helix transcriptional regulator [Methylophaga nitratireducenticrescens]|uniref:Transcriptional regulator n=1 Tax=Methylophaga nitratireducenticrescens TaxID=754476 RepID=I1XJQ2_METNJ|nr:MarR family transcriptional regulator [Methylophaga nitratireducenticrescens]AFI84621.1 MarR family transcriptional regulator [Methylophaga nitratireducenticrescens]AUZ84635.1 MarR family transcriptional regulator [Methylophaga nitratireducenticrescens]
MGPLLQDQVCFALYSTSGEVTKAYGKLLKQHRLTYPQFVVMMALWKNDGASPTQLASVVGLSKATLSPILKKLEATGYLLRKSVPDNEKTKSMVLTQKGREFAGEGEAIAKMALCATGLNETEVNQLIAICNKIKNNL